MVPELSTLRIGCLFSQEGNVAFLHKAQSPYSVNALAALPAQEAVRDTAYVESYVTEALAARELLCVGLEKMGIEYIPSQANFVLMRIGKRSIEIRDRLQQPAAFHRACFQSLSQELNAHIRWLALGQCSLNHRP
jgi:histidinol-phosphate aminotransferase